MADAADRDITSQFPALHRGSLPLGLGAAGGLRDSATTGSCGPSILKNPPLQAVAIAADDPGRGLDDELAHCQCQKPENRSGWKKRLPGFLMPTRPASSAVRTAERDAICDPQSDSKGFRERAANDPSGQWVLGFKYDEHEKRMEGRRLVFKTWMSRAG